MPILNVILVIAAVVFGAVAGIAVSTRCFRRHPGFARGAVVGGLFTLLASVMGGYVVAGRMEQLIGAKIGVPLGLAIGGFAGAFVQNTAAGAVSALISRIAHALCAKR